MKRLIAVLGLSIAALLPGLAQAQIGVIYACVTVSNGGVRIVSDPTSCKNGEQPIAWNQVGPQGPAGPQGPQGVSGPANVVLRSFERTVTLAPGENADIASLCLSGETAVGGGPSATPAPPIFVAWSTVVFDGGPITGWQVQFQNGGTATLTVTPRTSALCAPGSMTLG